jgi:hypothetical protein
VSFNFFTLQILSREFIKKKKKKKKVVVKDVAHESIFDKIQIIRLSKIWKNWVRFGKHISSINALGYLHMTNDEPADAMREKHW